MNLVKKLSFKTIVPKPAFEFVSVFDEDTGAEVKEKRVISGEYARIIGQVRETLIAAHPQYGDAVRFKGAFRGTNILTGETYESGDLFLPGTAETYLYSGFLAAKKSDTFESVEFAFDIGLKYQPKRDGIGVGYEYTVRPLIAATKQADPFAQLLQLLPPLPVEKLEKESEVVQEAQEVSAEKPEPKKHK